LLSIMLSCFRFVSVVILGMMSVVIVGSVLDLRL